MTKKKQNSGTEEKELTTAESDALILKEMGLSTEDDSKTNDNDEANQDDSEEDDSDDSNDSEEENDDQDDQDDDSNEEEDNEDDEEDQEDSDDEEDEEEDDEEEEDETKSNDKAKKGNNVKKLLNQRNEARNQVKELTDKVKELEANGQQGSDEHIQALVDKRLAQIEETATFFEDNTELKPHKKDIVNYGKELGLPLERAAKLYLAENNPDLLLEAADRNKKKSKIHNLPANSSKNVKSKKITYSDQEFEDLVKKGEIQF